jgi:hypothetical protein
MSKKMQGHPIKERFNSKMLYIVLHTTLLTLCVLFSVLFVEEWTIT